MSATKTGSTADLSALSVLIVDDNHHMITIVKTLLRGFGMKKLEEARDAADAFEKFNATPFDLIIVDFLMAPLDGLDFIRLVRTAKDSANPYVPIILLTAYSEVHRIREARDMGVNEFLCKPVTAKELYRKLISIIAHPRPFVRTKSYFGPDRRRRHDVDFDGTERRGPKRDP